jgi:hypothetical protein
MEILLSGKDALVMAVVAKIRRSGQKQFVSLRAMGIMA